MANPVQQRRLLVMAGLLLITLGFYFYYWLYQTKEEINKLGGTIPTLWFAILPFFNIYFLYRYAQDFIKYIHRKEDTGLKIGYFLLLFCLPIIAIFVLQSELNRFAMEQSGLFGKLKTLIKTK